MWRHGDHRCFLVIGESLCICWTDCAGRVREEVASSRESAIRLAALWEIECRRMKSQALAVVVVTAQ
jgi:hypothetical protein